MDIQMADGPSFLEVSIEFFTHKLPPTVAPKAGYAAWVVIGFNPSFIL
jgi:hypothetical protein